MDFGIKLIQAFIVFILSFFSIFLTIFRMYKPGTINLAFPTILLMLIIYYICHEEFHILYLSSIAMVYMAGSTFILDRFAYSYICRFYTLYSIHIVLLATTF